MKYTKLNPEDFKHLTWDAGIIVDTFDPKTATLEASTIRWATTGQNSFSSTRELSDLGTEINNAPEGMMELQKAKPWQAQLTGTAKSVDAQVLCEMLGNADVEEISEVLHKITPRNTISLEDFKDKWLIVNYSELNGETKGGFIALHLMNTFALDGFTANFDKDTAGQFPYTLKTFYSMSEQTKVPFEIYIKQGEAEAA